MLQIKATLMKQLSDLMCLGLGGLHVELITAKDRFEISYRKMIDPFTIDRLPSGKANLSVRPAMGKRCVALIIISTYLG